MSQTWFKSAMPLSGKDLVGWTTETYQYVRTGTKQSSPRAAADINIVIIDYASNSSTLGGSSSHQFSSSLR
jgi:hypothetical protein